MPRLTRREAIASTNVYHIITRGINKQNIFFDEDDKNMFIETMSIYKRKYKFSLLAYALMDNHVHIVLKDDNSNISNIMHDICSRYAKNFNSKYERRGHLFQNRFKSLAVESQGYLMNLVRYVHKNPEKENIAKIEDYKWSSYDEFLHGQKIVDVDFVLHLFDDNRNEAIKKFIDFHKKIEKEFSDAEFECEKLTDEELIEHIKRIYGIKNVQNIQKLANNLQAEYIKKICKIKGTYIEQIARVLGINKRKIYRIK